MGGRAILVAGVCLLALAGCGTEEPATAPELWCDGMCQAVDRCVASASNASCQTSCVEYWENTAQPSVPGAAIIGRCLAKTSCDVLQDDDAWDAQVQTCWEEAKGVVQRTPRVRAFCTDYSLAWFECGSWLSTDECEARFSLWSEDVIDELVECLAEPTCEDLDVCVGFVFYP